MSLRVSSKYGAEGKKEKPRSHVTKAPISEQFGDNVEMPDLHALQKLPYMDHSTKVGWLIRFLQKTLLETKFEKVVVVTQVSKRDIPLLSF